MDNNKEKLFFGKVLKKEITVDGKPVAINKLLVDNPLPTKRDGSIDPYHKAQLVLRLKDGREYLVKQAIFGGVSDKSAANGFTKSIAVDLNDEYSVTKLKG